MERPALLVLLPTDRPSQGAPSARPLGRAALNLEREGITILVGDQVTRGRIHAWQATEAGWTRRSTDRVVAVHDRYPSEARSRSWKELRESLGDVLFGNPPDLTTLCKDKLACQTFLSGLRLDMPEVEAEAARFEERLTSWGSAFLKPRRGSGGAGVRLVRSSQDLRTLRCSPAESPQAKSQGNADWILQRAVDPPAGLAGLALRVLVQREVAGGWWIGPAVARQSTNDPVVNAARGAEVLPGEAAVSAECLTKAADVSAQVADALAERPAGDRLVELGLDFVVGRDGLPHLIEVNSAPRGRLLYLARLDPQRWQRAHQLAVERPLRRLLAIASCGAKPASGPARTGRQSSR